MVAATTADNVVGKIDARPVRPTSKETPWDEALAIRDRIAQGLRETLQREKLDAAVFVSSNGNYPPWVQLQVWLPAQSMPKPAAPLAAGRWQQGADHLDIHDRCQALSRA